jgi:hypothetical protein
MAKTSSMFAKIDSPVTQWFSARGSVVQRGSTTQVFVGGTLIGSFEDGEQFERNAILVQLADDPRCHLGRLADAFGMSTERLRQLRREYEQGGLEALCPGQSGGPRRLSEREVTRLERLFAKGVRPREAHEQLKVASLSTISRAYRAWRARRSEVHAASSAPIGSAESRTLTLPGLEMLPTTSGDVEAPSTATAVGLVDEVRGGAFVQHVGTWLLIAMVARLGLYKAAEKIAVNRAPFELVRVGFDATIAAFAIGERALEGVRRLRTPTAKLLLQSTSFRPPSRSAG